MAQELQQKSILEWSLFKNGLFLPEIESKTTAECVAEGLRLLSSSLLRKQDDKLHSLSLFTEEAGKNDSKKSAADLAVQEIAKKRSKTFIRR